MPKPTVEARLTQHDREIAAIRKLIMQGMKLVVSNEKAYRRLTDAQRVTEKKLEALIEALGRGGRTNGKPRGHGSIH
jgi:ABC-type Fe3+-citrate transport system substrate-binding protein